MRVTTVKGLWFFLWEGKKWSEIFTEHEINLNFLHEKLAIKQEELIKTFSGMSPDKVAVSENTATMPPEVQVG